MKFASIFSVIAVGLSVFVRGETLDGESKIVKLTGDNFEEFFQENRVELFKFLAPWGQKLQETLQDAQGALDEELSDSETKMLPPPPDAPTNWLEEVMRPAHKEVQEADVEAFVTGNAVTAVVRAPRASAEWNTAAAVARKLRQSCAWALVPSEKLRVDVSRRYGLDRTASTELSEPRLDSFVQVYSLPAVGELTHDNYGRYTSTGLDFVVLVGADGGEAARFEPLAATRRDRFHFVFLSEGWSSLPVFEVHTLPGLVKASAGFTHTKTFQGDLSNVAAVEKFLDGDKPQSALAIAETVANELISSAKVISAVVAATAARWSGWLKKKPRREV